MKNNNNKLPFLNTRKAIKKWLDKHKIKNSTINDDLSVDVNDDVSISGRDLKAITIKFGVVTGNFWCNNNKLTNLVGSPESVGRGFDCNYNKLTNLSGSPIFIIDSFWCSHNKLTSLEGSPKTIGGSFVCLNSSFTSLLEIISCNFKETFYFNIDKDTFKQNELVKLLEKYYNKHNGHYELTGDEFRDIVKPVLEKRNLQQKLNISKTKIQTKASFI